MVLLAAYDFRSVNGTFEVAKKELSIMPPLGSRERPKLVVIGDGMAAGRVLEELLARDAGRYEITVFGAEPRVNYNRIMLSPVLAGEKTYEEIVIHDDAWYARHGVVLRKGENVTAIGREARMISNGFGRRRGL